MIRNLHEMAIEAVAVYSTADRDAYFVELADEAVCIGAFAGTIIPRYEKHRDRCVSARL